MGKYFLLIITILSSLITAKDTSDFALFNIKLDTSHPITVKPDLKDLGSDIGSGMGDIFRHGARSFAQTTNSDEYNQNMSRGMGGVARSLGTGMKEFHSEAEKELFPHLTNTVRGFASSAINARNVFQFGGLMALGWVITTTGYYLTKFVWEVISYKVLNPKPVILLPQTKYGMTDRFKRWWNGYKTPPMVFNDSVKERLIEIEEKAKHIRTHNKIRANKYKQISYDNLLLHGKPGTGKTLFARILADKTNMDFVATTAASLLQSGVSGIKYFNDIMKMAQKSRYGMIIFIDEADALFVDRDTLNPDSDHYKVLNHILAITGDGNNKCMLIAATNHAYVMDDAMSRRFQDRVLMPLPDESTRKELINLYAHTFLFNTQDNNKHYVIAAQKLLTPHTIEHIVIKTANLSHAEIKDMIEAIRKKALTTQNGTPTAQHINDALNQALEKHTATKEDRIKRETRFKTAV